MLSKGEQRSPEGNNTTDETAKSATLNNRTTLEMTTTDNRLNKDQQMWNEKDYGRMRYFEDFESVVWYYGVLILENGEITQDLGTSNEYRDAKEVAVEFKLDHPELEVLTYSVLIADDCRRRNTEEEVFVDSDPNAVPYCISGRRNDAIQDVEEEEEEVTEEEKQFIIVNDGEMERSYIIRGNDPLFAKLTNEDGLDEDGVLCNLGEFDNENKGLATATPTKVECGDTYVELFEINPSDLKEVLWAVKWGFRYDTYTSQLDLLSFLLGKNYKNLVRRQEYNGVWVAK